ncbi:MAG TPA: site-specific integrase [Marmoricola sp.]|nr:site-specific integrase [Marmoricola sp.]
MKGTVRRRSNGDWEYRFDAGIDPLTGKRRRPGRSGFRTRREAEQALRGAISAHEHGRTVRASGRTVAQFLEEWHAAIKPSVRASTWATYRNYLRFYVVPHIGETRLQDLTPVRLNLLYGHLMDRGRVRGEGGLAPKTIVNVHRMLHRALRDGVRWDMTPRNAAEDAQPPRAGRPRLTVWDPEEMGRFVDQVRGDRFYALWLLAATTGMRRGELSGLLSTDVDFKHARVSPTSPRVSVNGQVRDSEAKTEAGIRVMALDPVTLQALRAYVEMWAEERRLLGQPRKLLFVRPDGTPVHPDTVTDMFGKHLAAAGLPKIRLHDLRHSYASAALKSGVSPKVVSERLGHTSAAFTMQTYMHVIPGMDAAAANQIADLILGRGDEFEASTDAEMDAGDDDEAE